MAFSPDLNQTLVSSLNLIPTSEYGPLSFTADDYWRAVINIIINIDINIISITLPIARSNLNSTDY